MPNYVATFHTHLSAMLSARAIKDSAQRAAMAPVPRALSSSCGTCVRYTAEEDLRRLMDRDLESIALETDREKYRVIYRAPDPE